MASRDDEVTSLGTELGDQLDGGRAFEQMVGSPEHCRVERGVGQCPSPIGPELSGAVDDRKTEEPGVASELAGVGREADLVGRLP